MTLIALVALTPLAVGLGPLALRLAALGGGHQIDERGTGARRASC